MGYASTSFFQCLKAPLAPHADTSAFLPIASSLPPSMLASSLPLFRLLLSLSQPLCFSLISSGRRLKGMGSQAHSGQDPCGPRSVPAPRHLPRPLALDVTSSLVEVTGRPC